MRFLLFCCIYIIVVSTLSAKTFTLQEYGEMIHTVEIIAKQSLQQKDYMMLVKELQRLPDKIDISYSVQDKTMNKTIALSWLKTYLNNYISEAEEDNGKKTIEILENAKEFDDEVKQSKIVPITEKIHILIMTLQNMREELLLMGYKSEDEQTIKNKLGKLLLDDNQEKESKKDNWLKQKLERIYTWINKNMRGIKNIWNWFLFIVIIGIVVYLGILAKRYIKKSQQFVEETTHSGLLQADDPRNSNELVLKAKQYEKIGSLRMAVRYYYVAFIIGLEENNILPYQPNFTNWEYQRKLYEMGYTQEEIYFLTAWFDKVWYGMYLIQPTEFRNYILNYEKIKNLLATAKT